MTMNIKKLILIFSALSITVSTSVASNSDTHAGQDHESPPAIKDSDHGHEHHDQHEHADNDGSSEHGDHERHVEHEGHGDDEGLDNQEGHNDHGGPDDQEDHGAHDENGGNASGHDHAEGNDNGIELSEEQNLESGLRIQKAVGGDLSNELTLVGEVHLNQDRVSHIVPSVPGIVTRVHKALGDVVEQGETLAVLRSVELAEAKSDYFEAYNEVGISVVDLKRVKEVTANTEKLLQYLKDSPSPSDIDRQNYGDMGEYRTSLLSSYSELMFAKRTFARKKQLFDDKIASESDFLEAQTAYEKAQAEFKMAVDNAHFEIRQSLLESERKVRVNGFKLKTAQRRLEVMGLTEEQIASQLVEAGATGGVQIGKCTYPNCSDCESHGANEKHEKAHGSEHGHDHGHEGLAFAEIAVKAPFPGVIVEKHITLGEKLDEGAAIFTIADLSEVWIDLRVPARDVQKIRKDKKIDIKSENGLQTTGTIDLAMPVVNEETRTALARVTLDNRAGDWRPGTFVTGHILTHSSDLKVVVDDEAIQNIEGQDVVFVPSGHGFKPKPVVIGERDRRRVQILSGLSVGEPYVSRGAFELKAVKVTSGAGAHAGHGH